MGTYLNPNDDNSFIELANARNTDLFVDKTDFLRITNSLLNKAGSKLMAMTRPRRFGKSVMADMLSAYYSKSYEGREIFNGLKISLKEKTSAKKCPEDSGDPAAQNAEYEPDDSYLEHLNRFDVIHIDMSSIKRMYADYLKNNPDFAGLYSLVDFLQYAVIADLRREDRFSDVLERNGIGNFGLCTALEAIRKELNVRFIFIMDEWDLIYREYRDDTVLQDEYLDLLRGLFKAKTGVQCFSLVYLTGILPVKKGDSESDLNNFTEVNMLFPEGYERYFGFTETDVMELLQKSSGSLTFRELRNWYDGYRLNGTEIYNPNSVSLAIKKNKCRNYWRGTSATEEAVRLISLNYKGLKEDMILLIDGEKIKFNCAGFQNDMKSFKSKDDVISLLVCLGYLGCVDDDGRNSKNIENDDENEQNVEVGARADADNPDFRIAYVPNRELRYALANLVNQENWFRIGEIVRPSEELFDAICALNGRKAAEMIGRIHNSPDIFLFGYNKEEALVYCVISALIWKTHGLYQIRREEQGGKGRTDLIYEPNADAPNLPILVIEFKCNHSAQEAMDQIKKKQYYSRYLDDGYSNEILLLGISYDSKTKEHECLIEKVERSR